MGGAAIRSESSQSTFASFALLISWSIHEQDDKLVPERSKYSSTYLTQVYEIELRLELLDYSISKWKLLTTFSIYPPLVNSRCPASFSAKCINSIAKLGELQPYSRQSMSSPSGRSHARLSLSFRPQAPNPHLSKAKIKSVSLWQ